MLGQQKGDFFLGVEVFHDLKHLFHNLRRQAHGRLIEQNHAGVGHQRAADCAHLLLTAGCVGRLAGAPGFQAREVGVDLVQVGSDFGLAFAGVAAGEQVFFDGQVGEAVAPFHHLHHAALHQVGGGQVFDALAAQLDAALGYRAALASQQIADGAQRGGFARTVAAQNGHDGPLRDLQ